MSWASRLAKLAVRALETDAAEGAARRAAPLAVKRAEQRAAPLAVKKAEQAAPRALPAPPKRLALPAPRPGLPPHAGKPRGGQWWADREITGANFSPEHAARETTPVGLQMSSDPRDIALREWYRRAVPKYIKTDFASPDDPMRALAERGLLHAPDMTAEQWSDLARNSFIEDPIEQVMFGKRVPPGAMPGAGDDLRGEAMVAMPWLAKQPVTDNIYGVSPTSLSGLEFGHLLDEMRNAMSHEAHGIPADLAVRPEMLGRMSLPQAAERVGRINQFRAKQMEQAALSNLNSPAIHTFKEYPENNPMGLRWVELKAPDGAPTSSGLSETDSLYNQLGPAAPIRPSDEHVAALQDALRYEGDTMGHCVGGYCDDVLSGRSRIFSLRDAKGEPHVTIETEPRVEGLSGDMLNQMEPGLWDKIVSEGGHYDTWGWLGKNRPDLLEQFNARPKENIVQIKGKQNRAPKDDYLPFVQDFVKSGTWGDVGDLRNSGLVKLPDGRYITRDQVREGMAKSGQTGPNFEGYARFLSSGQAHPEDALWADYMPYFEGYAVGGRVSADRCFCRHPFAAGRR